jgi:hypothetical protein
MIEVQKQILKKKKKSIYEELHCFEVHEDDALTERKSGMGIKIEGICYFFNSPDRKVFGGNTGFLIC